RHHRAYGPGLDLGDDPLFRRGLSAHLAGARRRALCVALSRGGVMFSFEFLIRILPDLLRGLIVTVEATFGGFVLALIVGLLVALGRRSGLRPLRLICDGYIALMRCTPLLVQLYFVFYVLPSYGIRFPALATGILCLGLHIGAYIAEVYRAGIDGVPDGQW